MIILPSASAGIISSSKKSTSVSLGPPLPTTILLQGGWTSAYGTNIDGNYVKGNGTYFGTTIFYVNNNILVEDGYLDGFNFYPILFLIALHIGHYMGLGSFLQMI